MFNAKYKKIRFNAEFGPPSLFERVRYKMRDVTELYMDGAHFKARLSERDIPDAVIKRLRHFNIAEWTLRTAEVREDRGKFVDSTWEVEEEGIRYWVSVGLGNYITTIARKDSSGVEKCIRSGDYYDFVEQVNIELMDADIANNL
jgi:hypothetical protein